ncbi:MAG: hypothetical protein RR632_03625 [Christensenella sp.]
MSDTNDYRSEELKKRCCIADSELCDWLGKKGCYQCYICSLKSDSQKQEALEHWNVTLSYIPENIDDLHMSEECQFCKEEPPEKAEYYATFEMAHPEPYAEKGMILGLGKKVRTPIGSLVTIQAAIGKKCKSAVHMVDMLQIWTLVGFLIAAFVLLMIPQIGVAMANMFAFMPYIFIVLMLVAGYFLGKNLSAAHLKKIKKTIRADVSEMPLVRQMLDNGWSFFNKGSDGMTKMFFHKTKTYNRLRKSYVENTEAGEDITLDNINI